MHDDKQGTPVSRSDKEPWPSEIRCSVADIGVSSNVMRQMTLALRQRDSAVDATRWVQYSDYSLLATVEAIFNLGTLGRNDTSATPMSDLFRAESLRTSLASKVSTCQNC